MDEFILVARLESVISAALLADGRSPLVAHLAAAERAGAVGGKDLCVVGEFQKLGVKAV